MENVDFKSCSEKASPKKNRFPTSLQIYSHNQFLKNFYVVKHNRLALLGVCLSKSQGGLETSLSRALKTDHHRIIQVISDLRSSLVQPTAQNRVS